MSVESGGLHKDSTYHELNQPYAVGQVPDERRHWRVAIRLQLRVEPSMRAFNRDEPVVETEPSTTCRTSSLEHPESATRASRLCWETAERVGPRPRTCVWGCRLHPSRWQEKRRGRRGKRGQRRGDGRRRKRLWARGLGGPDARRRGLWRARSERVFKLRNASSDSRESRSTHAHPSCSPTTTTLVRPGLLSRRRP